MLLVCLVSICLSGVDSVLIDSYENFGRMQRMALNDGLQMLWTQVIGQHSNLAVFATSLFRVWIRSAEALAIRADLPTSWHLEYSMPNRANWQTVRLA